MSSAGAPGPFARGGAIGAGVVPRYRDTDERGNLLGAVEIFMRRIGQSTASKRHDALIALHLCARIDGHGQMALPEQRSRRSASVLGFGNLFRIKARVAPQMSRRAVLHDQEADGPIGLRLQNEPAVELERSAEQAGERDRLAQQPRDRLGIGVLG